MISCVMKDLILLSITLTYKTNSKKYLLMHSISDLILVAWHMNLLILYLHICLFLLYKTKIRDSIKALIYNIFSNTLIQNTILGNLTATMSDHLPQIVMLPNTFSTLHSCKSSTYESDWSSFVQENFILDFYSSTGIL